MPIIGQQAPHFKESAVFDSGEIKEISLPDYKGKWLVLFFYPLDFTFVCPTELLQFKECMANFQALGAEVIGVSVDSVYSHKKWLKDDLGDLSYPLISDLKKSMARDYSVLIEDQGIATRGTFIIDPEGLIQYMGIHNTNVGRDVKEILRVLEALKSEELCSAGWKSGDEHISVN